MECFILFQLSALLWSVANARPLQSAIKVPFYFNFKDLPMDLQIQVKLNTLDTIKYWGYPAEEHKVNTPDGYILGLQRIPRGRVFQSGRKPPVLILHGLGDTSFSYVANPPNASLGFILADAGFDVWLGNVRGNVYSRAHTTLNPDTDPEFFEYSFDQHALRDLPAMLDHIVRVSGFERVFYIGHSMGTTTAFAGLSSRPELNNRIRMIVALAPVARVGEVKNVFFQMLAPLAGVLLPLLDIHGTGEFAPYDPEIQQLVLDHCDEVKAIECDFLITGGMTFDPVHVNFSRVPVYMSHVPGGTSLQNYLHFAQGVAEKEFCMFDHGPVKNMQIYGQLTPPLYDIRKIRVPVALFTSPIDALADPDDVDWLKQELKAGGAFHYEKILTGYGHNHFKTSLKAPRDIFDEIIRLFKEVI